MLTCNISKATVANILREEWLLLSKNNQLKKADCWIIFATCVIARLNDYTDNQGHSLNERSSLERIRIGIFPSAS